MSQINNNDYKKILEYYKQSIPISKRQLKIQAEKILASKLCRCIKKIEPSNESKSIGICTKTIFNSKGFTRGKFKCKGKKFVTFRKSSNNKKTRKIKKY